MPSKYVYTQLGDKKIRLSSLDKILYPATGIRKAEVIEYYLKVSKQFLLFNSNHPMTLIRFPNGIDQVSFYAKEAPDWRPEWLTTELIHHSDGPINYPVIKSSADLVWLANLSALEFHPMQMNVEFIDSPEYMVFDLDPDPLQDFKELVQVTKELKTFLEDKGLMVFIKTSGGKGLHLFVPIRANITHEIMFTYVKGLATEFVNHFPKRTTLNISKEKRKSRILIDIFRNYRSHSTVAPYSLRGKVNAPVSFPFHWEFIDALPSSQFFTLSNFDEHFLEHGEAWSDFYKAAADIKTQNDLALTISKISLKKTNTDKSILNKPVHMLAGVAKEISLDKKYIYEVKWDGIRVFIIKKFDSVSIISRSGRDISKSFPEIVKDGLSNIPSDQVILDAELVCLDKNGKPIFADVISRMHSKTIVKNSKPSYAYIFDCLEWSGERITHKNLLERYAHLKSINFGSSSLRLSQHFDDGEALLQAAEKMELEGIMIKNKKSIYQEGQRSADWLKLKFRSTMTCTIIGFTEGNGDRKDLFGSLHLITQENKQFVYRGRVGTGFNQSKMKSILNLLKDLIVNQKTIRLKVEEENKTTWTKALLQCEVQYASITSNNTLREPVFLHLREDLASQ